MIDQTVIHNLDHMAWKTKPTKHVFEAYNNYTLAEEGVCTS